MSLNVDNLMAMEDTSNSPEEWPDTIEELPRYNHNAPLVGKKKRDLLLKKRSE